MSAIVFRLALLAGGLGLAQMALDSFAHGNGTAIVQFGLALVLLVAGSASFIVPLLEGNDEKEVFPHV